MPQEYNLNKLRRNGIFHLNPLLLPVVCMMAGMVVGSRSIAFVAPAVWFYAALATVLLLLVVWKIAWLSKILLLTTVFLIGAILMGKEERQACRPLPSQEVVYRAVVMSEPVVHGKVVQMDLLIVDAHQPLKVKAALLRDTVENRYRSLHLGDGIEACSLLEQPTAHPDASFDYARWLTVHGYAAQTFIYYLNWQKAAVDLTPLSWTDKLRYVSLRYRQRLVGCYREAANRVGDDALTQEKLGIVAAMTLGDKTMIPNDLKDIYSMVGSSHVLALSGLHLTILYAILSLLTFRRRRQWLIQGLLLLVIWTYVFLVGMPVSIVRSALMLSVYSLMTLSGRGRSPLNTLSLAALVILLVQPFALYDIGFQLSFLAVLSLVLFYRKLAGWLPSFVKRNIVLRPVADIAVVAIAAQIGTAPLVAFYFGRFSCCFLLANYIVTPCAFLILSCGLLSLLLIPFPLLQGFAMQVLLQIVGWQNAALVWLSSFSWASIDGIHLSVLQVISVYVAIAAVSLLIRQLSKIKAVPSAFFLILLVVSDKCRIFAE